MPVMLASESATGMDAMLKVMEQVVTFSMSLFTTVTSNPILAFIVGGSLVGIGISVFSQLKGAAH